MSDSGISCCHKLIKSITESIGAYKRNQTNDNKDDCRYCSAVVTTSAVEKYNWQRNNLQQSFDSQGSFYKYEEVARCQLRKIAIRVNQTHNISSKQTLFLPSIHELNQSCLVFNKENCVNH